MATALVFDRPGRRDAVGVAVRRLVHGKGPLRFAVAYVSGDTRELLGLSRAAVRRLRLVCDPFAGGCDPRLLLRLHRAGATVSFLECLHAKVFISTRRVVIGSANISRPALGDGNVEAACVATDRAAVARATRWFDSLRGRQLAEVHRDRRQWAAIEAAWARATLRTRRTAPSLLAALETMPEVLRDYAFTLHTTTGFEERTFKSASTAHDFPLPSGWSVESQDVESSRGAQELHRTASGKVVIGLNVTFDKRDRVARFVSVEPRAWRAERVLVHKKVGFTYYAPQSSDVRLGGADAKALCKKLTRGIRKHPRVAARLDFSSFVTPAELVALLAP